MDKPSKIIQEWLKFARQDLHAARALNALDDESMYRNIGFHCQQSAEKAIKAYLANNRVKFGKIHDIKMLGEEVIKLNTQVQGLMIRAISLTPFAVEYRYPESADRPITKKEILDALSLSELVLQAMIDLIQ